MTHQIFLSESSISPKQVLEIGLSDPPPSLTNEYEILRNIATLMVRTRLGRWKAFTFCEYCEYFLANDRLAEVTKIYLDRMATQGFFNRTTHTNPVFSGRDTYTPTSKLIRLYQLTCISKQ
ncbi:MAG: hypothetical protein HGA67_00215 [Candidatus Yonathbacteria bacterium]|nr:hypothetical protein [Candidatus Yonathbacteria bacterium]